MPSWKRVIVSGSSAHLNQITGSGGVKLPDSVRLNFGDANDMKIYHSGNHSIIQDTGTGNLRIKASIINIQGTSTAEDIATFTENAGVELYYDDSKKLETIRTGVDVTGAITASGDISGSSTSTGSFGRVENDSGRFYTSGSSLVFESPNLTDFKILQTGLGTNSAGPVITLGNAGQGNLNEGTIKFQIGRLVTNRGITADGQSVYATQFNTVNERGSAGTALFTATGNGGDGGGMYFGGGGAYDVRFSVTDEERLRLDTAGNGGGIQTSGSLSVGGLTAGAVAHVTASGNISSSLASTGSFGIVRAFGTSNNYFNGPVAVGTTNPPSGVTLQLQDDDDGVTVRMERNASTSTDLLGQIQFGNRVLDDELASIASYAGGSTTSGDLRFSTENTGEAISERMRISGSGDIVFLGANQKISGSSTSTGSFGTLGVGTTGGANGYGLHIKSSGTSTYPLFIEASDGSNLAGIYEGASGHGHFYIRSADGTAQIALQADGNDASFMAGGVTTVGDIISTGANKKISGSLTSTGSFGKLELGGAAGTLMRFGDTQVVGDGNVGDQGARYVFNVDTATPNVGVGIIAQNHTPHQFAILNKTYRNDGNFNHGVTLNQNNSGDFDMYVANELRFSVLANGNVTSKGSISATGNISGSSVSSSGDILADGDVIAYNSSDIRLKDNIEVIQGSLDKIGGIRGVEFDWNEKSPGWARERGHDIGVIAQEVQKVVPEIVVERKNGYLGVDYKRLVPLLIESVKELKEEVEELKKKVN